MWLFLKNEKPFLLNLHSLGEYQPLVEKEAVFGEGAVLGEGFFDPNRGTGGARLPEDKPKPP